MDYIKEAFQKVKQDIDTLKQEMSSLRISLIETRNKMIEMCNFIQEIDKKKLNIDSKEQLYYPTSEPKISTNPTQNPTLRQEIEGLKPKNLVISIGNGGVPTDRQTDRQTGKFSTISLKKEENSIDNALEILNSLDNLKKEIRLKFKRLTNQEVLIFSTIYQLEEEQGYTDYKSLSKKLNLSESSIRDYVQRIIKKGISVDKNRINNKIIHLSIPQNLKKIVSLSTILKLREL